MNETYVTVTGNACADPERMIGASGVVFTKFRVASTPRYHRRQTDRWEDGITSFFSVLAFAQLAENIVSSVKKGHPLVVHGRQTVKTFRRDDGSSAVQVEIEAQHIGHDLTKGATTFLKGGRLTVNPDDRTTDPVINELRVRDDAAMRGAWGAPRERTQLWQGGPTPTGSMPYGQDLPSMPYAEGPPAAHPRQVDPPDHAFGCDDPGDWVGLDEVVPDEAVPDDEPDEDEQDDEPAEGANHDAGRPDGMTPTDLVPV